MVETIRLESGHTLTGIVGSNPTLSAISFAECGWDCRRTVGVQKVAVQVPPQVNFTKRVKTSDGLRYLPPPRRESAAENPVRRAGRRSQNDD